MTTFTETEKHWRQTARELAERIAPIAKEMDEDSGMADWIIPALASSGLLGGPLPTKLGGSAMSALALATVYEELGRACSSVRGFMTVHTSLVMQCLNDWASAEQKQELIPKLANASLIGCYALTEPEAGSDAASIQTEFRRSGSGYRITGEKIWITNGETADIAIIFAKDAESSEEKPHRKIGAFVVPLNSKGIKREPMPGQELGHRASNHARLLLTDCEVPESSMLGKPGEGFRIAMSALDHGRLGVASGALGVHQACLDASLDFVRTRRQFGQRIGDFEMVQAAIADMKTTLEASRHLVYDAAQRKDAGVPYSLEASMAKYYATESALKAASDAVLLHGGRGYSNEYPVERYYRDIKGLQIYEGTSFIQKIVIARHTIGKEI